MFNENSFLVDWKKNDKPDFSLSLFQRSVAIATWRCGAVDLFEYHNREQEAVYSESFMLIFYNIKYSLKNVGP